MEGCFGEAGWKIMERELLTQIEGIPIFCRRVEDLPYNIALRDRARALRKVGVLSEVLFWKQVRNRQFHCIDFDRQRIIGHYIVDFYVKKLGLVVEIDGSSHDNKEEYDEKRQSYLECLGLCVYRIPDIRIKNDLAIVMEELKDYILQNFG